MTDELVVTKDLTVTFAVKEKRAKLRAVDGVDLTIHRGETVGLIGESGSGKSTLGRAVMQLTPPSSGKITFGDVELTGADRHVRRSLRRHMQMVFQDPNGSFNPRKRLKKSLHEPLIRQKRGDETERRALIERTLELVDIDPELLERFPHQLSGGQKQRLSIARALLLEPDLLVCDEVVSALDVSLQASVLNLLVDIKQDLGVAMLFITHDIGVVSYISDRVAVMYLGQVVEVGPTADVLSAPSHPYTSGLIGSRPLPLPSYAQGEDAPPLLGDMPSSIDPPSGCRFVTRCPYVEQQCHDEAPAFRTIAIGRSVRCHLAEQLKLEGVAGDPAGSPVAVDPGRATQGSEPSTTSPSATGNP